MKALFLTILAALIVASLGTWLMQPEKLSEHPVLYWTTGNDAYQQEQLRAFQAWQKEIGLPLAEIRIDNANRDITKRLIQGVSGVAADLVDAYGPELHLFQKVGMLSDLTVPAKQHGFSAERTYRGLEHDIVIDGRQWAFPQSVSVLMFWVNRDMFRKFGLEDPPQHWDQETFERIGLRYLQQARRIDPARKYYFASGVDRPSLIRSNGMSHFNETLTASRLDDPRYHEVLRTLYRWTHESHLIPTEQEERAFTLEASGRAARIALFSRGNYALLKSGRFAVITFRQYEPINLGVSYFPHFGFENTYITASQVALHADARHPELAYQFFQFLTSEPYNLNAVRAGASLPPVPEYARTELFARPPDHPNEWGTHELFVQAAESAAIPQEVSPFILPHVGQRMEGMAWESFIARRISAEEAGRMAEIRINQLIAQNLEDRPELRAEYQRRLAVQRKIDATLAAGGKVPAAWIYNPFHRMYYRSKGLLQDP
jgi:multiple sugar transport system substrate-binding protein